MSIQVDSQDISQYPGNIKRISVDQTQVVPTGFEGDEQYAIVISTTAYSDIVNSTKIQNLYILDTNVGWAKSSGLAGSAGKFMLDASHNTMRVKLDNTVSGTDGNGYYSITLEYNNDGTPKSGEDIAADIENKIRAISCIAADTGYQLSYKNSTVEFKESKFWISSGVFSSSYTGTYKSSVAVASGTSNDCTGILGFSMPITSESLAGASVMESLITSDYTTGAATLSIGAGTGVTTGDCLLIKDGSNIDYFTALNVAGNNITVAVSGTNGYDGIKHNYATANYAKVQILREQDPDSIPRSFVKSVDDVIRFGVKSIINQIDYSA